MAYRVRIMPRAERRARLTLETNPLRCPRTTENKNLRQLLYGRKPHVYRVVYRIAERLDEVQILHIRHGATDRI